jgi:hypothetical protein
MLPLLCRQANEPPAGHSALRPCPSQAVEGLECSRVAWLSGVQMPRMNALMERWVQTCRRGLLDRTLIWNQRHLLYALREFEQF